VLNLFKILSRVFKRRKKPRHKPKRKRLKKAPVKKTVRRKKLPSRKKVTLKKRPKVARRPKKAVLKKPQVRAIEAGLITHYFPKVNAAVIKLKKPLHISEPLWIKGRVTDFKQTVGSMQIDRKPIEKARAGQEIGLEVFREVRPGDKVFKLSHN